MSGSLRAPTAPVIYWIAFQGIPPPGRTDLLAVLTPSWRGICVAKEEEKKGEAAPAEAKPAKEKEEKKEKKGKERKGPQDKAKDRGPVDPNFRYIVRLASTDLDGWRPVMYALSDIKGIGVRTGAMVSDLVGVNRAHRIGNLNDEQIAKLQDALNQLATTSPPWMLNRQYDWETGEDRHVFGPDWQIEVRNDVNRMKKIRSYRGVRHEAGKKVRGQRTKSNGRKGLALGVQRGAAIAAAKAAAEAEAGGGKEGGKPAAAGAAPAAAGAAPAKADAKPAAAGGAKPAADKKPAEAKK
jgi:small subunit ribosomal protein S13